MTIIRIDPAFDALVPRDAQIEKVAGGFIFIEGPIWRPSGALWFSDVVGNVVRQWSPDGTVKELLRPGGYDGNSLPAGGFIGPNGMTAAPNGDVLLCQHGNRRIVRVTNDLRVTTLVDKFDGKRLNAPNDAIVHPNGGGILFTDPGYGSHWYYEGTVRELELPTSVYHIDPQNARVTRLTDEILKPNGLCFSPDLRYVYIADTAPTHHPKEKAKLYRWDVQDNGRRLTNRREFAVLDAGFHDGIRADVDGNIWCATGFGGDGVDGVHVYAPDGAKIGQIVMPEGTANLCFVGKHRNRLFMTSSQSVYTLYTAAQGAHIT
jgi:gluconolactonase